VDRSEDEWFRFFDATGMNFGIPDIDLEEVNIMKKVIITS
jgi:hypothetical protein